MAAAQVIVTIKRIFGKSAGWNLFFVKVHMLDYKIAEKFDFSFSQVGFWDKKFS